jgi:hypothetical protein
MTMGVPRLSFTSKFGLLFATACRPVPLGGGVATYHPQSRELTVTAVPLLVKESAALFPFLKPDCAAAGVLEGKEVYAFVPSSLMVV